MNLKKKLKFAGQPAKLSKAVRGIIVISPMLWLLINLLVLILCILIMPDAMIVTKVGMIMIILGVINGWFWAMLLMTYLFRDASHKFIAPGLSAPLGVNDGFLGYVPEDTKTGEPQYTIRALSGFAAYGVHLKGRVLCIYPTKYERRVPAGGIVANFWPRACQIDELPEGVRTVLTKESVAIGVYSDPNELIWFGRAPFLPDQVQTEKDAWHWDGLVNSMNKEINRLKAIVQEKDFQIESYELSRSREAFKLRPADSNFREMYNQPPESIDEKTRRLYSQAQQEMDDRKRRGG